MSESRQQDQSSSDTHSRSDRVFSQQNLWYFKTREGDDVGPFRYRSEAESNLDRFLEQLKEKFQQRR
jgi:hypothetical protein